MDHQTQPQPRPALPPMRSYADLATDPAYRILPAWVGGHGPVTDAVPFQPSGAADTSRPIYRQWYGRSLFEIM